MKPIVRIAAFSCVLIVTVSCQQSYLHNHNKQKEASQQSARQPDIHTAHDALSSYKSSNQKTTASSGLPYLSHQVDEKKTIVRTLPSQELLAITEWIDNYFINTQLSFFSECTNAISPLLLDLDSYRRVMDELKRYEDKYGTVAIFMEWYLMTNRYQGRALIPAMTSNLTEKTLPFYLYALSTLPREIARQYTIAPDKLIGSVIDASKLWDAGLIGLANMYYEFAGEEAVIAYWDTIVKYRPELTSAATVHKMNAAWRLNDAERAIAFLKSNLDEVRKQQWTIDRAISVLGKITHPDALALSNALLTVTP